MNTTSFFPFYTGLSPDWCYTNPITSSTSSNSGCIINEEHTFNDDGFIIATSKTSSCDSEYLVLYNWYYD